jgi:hypothetical protein
VYRARRYKPRFAVTLEPRPAHEPPASQPSQQPQMSRATMKEDMAAVRRRFWELAQPPKPGEPNPLA